MQEDGRGVRKGFTSISNVLSEDGKGNGSRESYTEMMPYAESCLKNTKSVRPVTLLLKRKRKYSLKALNVIQSQRRDMGTFSYSCLAIVLKESHLVFYFQGQFETVISKYKDRYPSIQAIMTISTGSLILLCVKIPVGFCTITIQTYKGYLLWHNLLERPMFGSSLFFVR